MTLREKIVKIVDSQIMIHPVSSKLLMSSSIIDQILKAVKEAAPKKYPTKTSKGGQFIDFIGSKDSGETLMRWGYNQAIEDFLKAIGE
jgi:hypothetical protein